MSPSRTTVITGATSGIGQLVAIALAKQGEHVVLTARSESKAAATRALIEAAAPRSQVDVHFVDFARLDSVAAAATEIASRHARIDVLINNAGLHAFSQRITSDGFAEMVAVNYLAPWVLTNILREKIVSSAPSRIVTVASEASRRSGGLVPRVDLFDTNPFTRLGSSTIYGKTKLMDIMFSQELARQLEGEGVAVNCLDPGFNVTGLGRELGFAAPLERLLNWLRVGDPSRGAGIILRLATDAVFGLTSGGYFSVKDARPLTPVSPGDDVAAQRELWVTTAKALTGKFEGYNWK